MQDVHLRTNNNFWEKVGTHQLKMTEEEKDLS